MTTSLPIRRSQVAVILPWVPACIALLVMMSSLGGLHLVSRAQGALDSTTEVVGAVDADVQLDMSECSTANSLSFGTFTTDTPTSTPEDCVISFGSNNNVAGATLLVQESPTAGPGATFKCIGGSCGSATIQDVTAGTTPPAAQSSAFGLTLQAAGGAANAVWSTSATPPWYPAPDDPSTACQTASVASGTCAFRFQVYAASGSVNPGTFQGQVRFVVLPR